MSSVALSLAARLALIWEVVTGGLIELWAHSCGRSSR